MPKAFTPTEKTKIRAALQDIGLKHFQRHGIRAARVDDICRDTGIAKGSFYSFFASKEDLFMTIANARDQVIKMEITTYLNNFEGSAKQLLGAFFDTLMRQIETDLVLKIAQDSGEISHLIRKVSPALLAENRNGDIEFLRHLAELLRTRHQLIHADAKTLEGLMTLMLALSLQARAIEASADYAASVDLLRDLFLTRLLNGPSHD